MKKAKKIKSTRQANQGRASATTSDDAQNSLLQRALKEPGVADAMAAFAACEAAMGNVATFRPTVHISFGDANTLPN